MSTMKYKVSERYITGWTDPRSGYGGTHGYSEVRMEDMPVDDKHFSAALTTEQLRAAWLLEYGDRMVPYIQLVENEDMCSIGRQLYARGQLIAEKQFETYSHCYYLTKKHADN